MTTSSVRSYRSIPQLFFNDELIPPIAAYGGPRYLDTFHDTDVHLYSVYARAVWWVGPDTYDFDQFDAVMEHFLSLVPDGYLMPRVDLKFQGFPWWGEQHPGEMNVLLDLESGEPRDQLANDPEVLGVLGHPVNLEKVTLHSFHSQVWRRDIGKALEALVEHCERSSYADRIWAWHPCDGLFLEWFHWNEYAFRGLADYSPAAEADFRRWLRRTYQDDAAKLSRAWGHDVDFAEVSLPTPQERARQSHLEFYDPVLDRPAVDYAQCFSDSIADNIISVCESVKAALPRPKATCIFYGYQFCDMPRIQLNGHLSLERVLASPAVDMIASPHVYANRGEGGYHGPQAIGDVVRRAGKLHFDEIDCKTVWTPEHVTWKRHISQPKTVASTIEMMKKDAAYQLTSATALWWMDLTDDAWFDAPEARETIRRLRDVEIRLQECDRRGLGEVAVVLSQRAMAFQAPRAGLHNVSHGMFRNWHLGRMGAPFEELVVADLTRPGLPAYKLYIFPDAFYLSDEERAIIDRVVKRNGATVLWLYADGFLSDTSASVENMLALTGIRLGRADIVGELDVRITDHAHALTADLPQPFAYGTGVDRDRYTRPPRPAYVPETAMGPAFYVDDADADVLGTALGTGKPGLAVKDFGEWRSVYSAAPLVRWQLLRNIAREAGVNIYDDAGDYVWGSRALLAINALKAGRRSIHFPRPTTVTDAWADELLATRVMSLELDFGHLETKLLLTE